MIIKADIQGWLIYSTMVGYLFVFLSAMICPKVAKAIFAGSFFFAAAALIYRWIHVAHIPMQNMFEVFLFLGFCVWPIHILSTSLLQMNQRRLIMTDAAIGIVMLFPARFIFDHQPQYLPPALQYWLFAPHVAAYMVAYVFAVKAALLAVEGLIFTVLSNNEKNRLAAESGYRLIAISFPLLTLGLFLGSVWGKYAWGDWWGWDPKELWSLVCWLVYALYLHARFTWPKKYAIHHFINIIGLICIIITLLWVNLSKIFPGLHNYAS